ncbi:MAG: OmpA family protein [Verrucomicrobiia bacterium]|jgi:peptidoglycan-associated lipoprotein
MRSRFLSHAVVVTLIATLGLTGCKNFHWPWQKKTPAPAAQQPPPLGEGAGIPSGERPIITGELTHGQFPPVYFDFDSVKIRPSEVAKLEAVAAALKGNSNKLVIEGYCDERGTAEYNRALGERRAEAAREKLVALGVAASRITTISYGRDRPADLGHDETAWAKNRRCEFSIVKE